MAFSDYLVIIMRKLSPPRTLFSIFIFIVLHFEWSNAIGPLASLTSPEDSFVNAIEGFGTDLQCFVNKCVPPGKKVQWYKDDKLIAEGTEASANGSRRFIRHTVEIDKRRACEGSCSSIDHCGSGMYCLDNACCTCSKEEYTLVIYNLTLSDAGVYQCRLEGSGNIDFQLNVLEGGLLPTFSENITFDYTDCCKKEGISEACRPMCKPNAIEAHKFDPIPCQQEFGKLLKCASQNGNTSHSHCCRLEYVPQFCSEYCTAADADFGKANRLCVYWMPEIFSCYERAYLPLPGHPEQLSVSVSNSTSLKVCWKPPRIRPETIRFYTVRYQEVPRLPFFTGTFGGDDFEETDYSMEELPPIPHEHGDFGITTTRRSISTARGNVRPPQRKKRQTLVIATHNFETNETDIREYRFLEVNTTGTCAEIYDLKPLTQYTIYVTATNEYGSSLPSVRAHAKTNEREFSNITLPDVRKCCADRGVQADCAAKMCEISQTKSSINAFDVALTCRTEFPNVAPCLADGRDHTECCRSKNVGSECLKLCNGSSTHLAISSVLCLSLDMSSIYSCLRQGYETHPSPPTNVSVSHITGSSAIISWSPPKDNGEKVNSYSIFYKNPQEEYKEIRNVTSPYELEELEPDDLYSVYLIAYTPEGKSLKSTAMMFYTGERSIDGICPYGQPLRDEYGFPLICGGKISCPTLFECVDSENDDDDAFYCCPTRPFVEPEGRIKDPNITACCISKGVTGKCLKLCSYETTTEDLVKDGRDCVSHIHTWLQCGGDGRDNRPCCEKENVPKLCNDFCYPSLDEKTVFNADHIPCTKHVREISKCTLEGVYSLPGPPRFIRHLTEGPNWATIRWDLPWQPISVDYYEVDFGNESQQIRLNSTGLSITLRNLKPGIQYSVKVRSVNLRGASTWTGNYTFSLNEGAITPTGTDFPRPPSRIKVEWYRDRKANLSWTWMPETMLGNRIVNCEFNVSYGEALANGSRVNWKSATTKATFIVVENLKENATYDAYVRAKDMDTKTDGIPGPVTSFKARTAKSAPSAEIVTIPDGPYDVGDKLELSCFGTGDPTPNVTLEAYGRVLASGEALATALFEIKSVEDQNEEIICTADNGHYNPYRTTYSLKVKYKPQISPYVDPIHVIQDLPARLVCGVRAYPTAEVSWYYQSEEDKKQKRRPKLLNPNDRYDEEISVGKVENAFNATLTVNQAEPNYAGYYYCEACNDVGCVNASVKLIVEPYPVPPGPDYILDCCKKQRVRSDCMSACTADIDIRVYETNLHCLDEFPKLLFCSKDGMDHSECCNRHGVPNQCLSYCNRRLLTVDMPLNLESCASFTSDIVSCVEAGHQMVPNVPYNVRVHVINQRTVNVSWDPSEVYDGSVSMYVVYYKHELDQHYSTIQTEKTWVLLTDLDWQAEYNITAIAANRYGFSMFSPSVSFKILSVDHNALRKPRNAAGTAVAIIFMLLVVVAIVVAAIYFSRRPQRFPELIRKLRGNLSRQNGTAARTGGAVAFENPGYDTEAQVRVIPANGANGTTAPNGSGSTSTNATWERADLETTTDDVSTMPQRGMKYTQFA